MIYYRMNLDLNNYYKKLINIIYSKKINKIFSNLIGEFNIINNQIIIIYLLIKLN